MHLFLSLSAKAFRLLGLLLSASFARFANTRLTATRFGWICCSSSKPLFEKYKSFVLPGLLFSLLFADRSFTSAVLSASLASLMWIRLEAMASLLIDMCAGFVLLPWTSFVSPSFEIADFETSGNECIKIK